MIPPFAIAFQPILDVETGRVLAQEALVRGPDGEGAGSVLAAIAPGDRLRADAVIRRRAVEEALRLGLAAAGTALALNIYPSCLGQPGLCIADTAAEAAGLGFPPEAILFEISETEPVEDAERMASVLRAHQRRGLRIALDDVGTGHARLPLMLAWRPDLAKVAREVVTGLDHDQARHEEAAGLLAQLGSLGVAFMVEGIETQAEMEALRALGARVMQGYLFARPALGALPPVVVPGSARHHA